MEMIFEAIMNMVIDLWEGYMDKKGRQHDIRNNKKLIRMFKIIFWNVLVIAGGLLILLIIALVMLLTT